MSSNKPILEYFTQEIVINPNDQYYASYEILDEYVTEYSYETSNGHVAEKDKDGCLNGFLTSTLPSHIMKGEEADLKEAEPKKEVTESIVKLELKNRCSDDEVINEEIVDEEVVKKE